MKASKLPEKLNLKKILTEASLWLLFLFVCGLIGYGQGLKPHFKVSDYVVSPNEIHILTISDHFFPPEVIQEIEHSTHTKIIISTIQSWDQLKIKLIETPSPEIVFIPSHWAQTLNKEGLLNTDPTIKTNLGEMLVSDFSVDSQFFIATYWAKLSLMTTTEKDKSIAFLNDADLFLGYLDALKKDKQDTNFIKHTIKISNMDLWFKDTNIDSAEIGLSTHILSLKKPNWKKTSYPDSFYTLGFSFGKNSRNLKQSLEVLEYYMSLDIQMHLQDSIPFASTLAAINENPAAPNEIKSSFLRTLDFNKMIILKSKASDANSKANQITAPDSF